MKHLILWNLFLVIDMASSDKPGEMTFFSIVGVRMGCEWGLRLIILGHAAFILWVPRKEVTNGFQ